MPPLALSEGKSNLRARSCLHKAGIREKKARVNKGRVIAGSLNTDKFGLCPRDSKLSKLLATQT